MTNEKVTEAKIFGEYRREEKGIKLFMIAWRRIANSGIVYGWAQNEADAVKCYGWSPKFVKHTVVEINPSSMPVEIGEERFSDTEEEKTPFYTVGTHVVHFADEGGFDNPDNHFIVKSTKRVNGKTLYTISRDEIGSLITDIEEDDLFPVDAEDATSPIVEVI